MKALLAIGICLLGSGPALAQHARPIAGTQLESLRAASTWSAPAHIHPAVARIVAPGNGSISYGSGTLVWANEQYGLVVTNWHVINEVTGQISVHFPDGFYSLGHVQRADRDWDLAAIAIRRPPNIEPVRLADEAPRPGEVLTIAGYGSGNYRSASGRCTQYVAPGVTFPYEMVEVAVSARQGDSGGPILNSKGELAGVLFGEGNGRTSGSYCGRVRWFLSSVVPGVPDSRTMIASAPAKQAPARPAVAEVGEIRPLGSPGRTVHELADHRATLAPVPPRERPSVPVENQPAKPAATTTVLASAPEPPLSPPMAQVQTLGWEDVAGTTLAEQAKTVLAAIGLLGMVLHVLRWLSSEPAAK